MQVFVPTDSIGCVNYLDPKRRGNQIWREAKTILNGGWYNHPASKMWRGHEQALCHYALIGLYRMEADGKSYPHHIQWFEDKFNASPETGLPWWWGREDIHSSHRAALLRKGLEDETFRRAKERLSLEHSDYPNLKSQWRPVDYARYWDWNGKPDINETWYGQFGWTEDPAEPINAKGSLPYVWPV